MEMNSDHETQDKENNEANASQEQGTPSNALSMTGKEHNIK